MGLAGVHAGGGFGGFVVVAVEVEEAVDEVEGEFVFEREVPGVCFAAGDVGADDDLAVRESDDVGGRGIAEELCVDRGHGGIIDDAAGDGVFDFDGVIGAGLLEAKGEGGFDEVPEPVEIERNGFLEIVDLEEGERHQAAETESGFWEAGFVFSSRFG